MADCASIVLLLLLWCFEKAGVMSNSMVDSRGSIVTIELGRYPHQKTIGRSAFRCIRLSAIRIRVAWLLTRLRYNRSLSLEVEDYCRHTLSLLLISWFLQSSQSAIDLYRILEWPSLLSRGFLLVP